MGIFSSIVNEVLKQGLSFTSPQSFKNYLKKTDQNIKMTAPYISVDFLEKLDSELKENNLMVFRLGSPSGESGTHFALAKSLNNWDDYFLDERKIFHSTQIQEYELTGNLEKFITFKMLPKLTETSLVNLFFASGIMREALKLDKNNDQIIPSTCQSTFTFDFKPHIKLDARWKHQNGQVEIDALFFGSRENKKELYLIESKFGNNNTTLAKHKLAYPYLSLLQKIPQEYQIIPIYLKTFLDSDMNIHFNICECEFNSPTNSINELVPKTTSRFVIKNFFI